jgi:hypothetical protein
VDSLYGMTTPQEQAFCRDYAARELSGRGEVVDLGCWLGASTVSLLQGMAVHRSPAVRDRSVHAYDRFVWEAWMEPIVAGTPLAGRFAAGDSFLDEFEARVSLWRERIDVHSADLTEPAWSGQPIEFLFVDAMKDRVLTTMIARDFFPSLVPGAIVLHQDYIFPWCPWIHVLMARLAAHFEPVAAIEDSYGVVFRVRKRIPVAKAEAAGLEPWTEQDIHDAFALASTMVGGPRLPRIWAAKLVALAAEGHDVAFERELADPRVLEGVTAEPLTSDAVTWARAQFAAH